MQFIKTVSLSFFLLLCATSASNCSSSKNTKNQVHKSITQEMQEITPFKLGEAYYKHWVAGVKGGGSGITLFIPIAVNPENIVLETAYFRGMQAKLETTKSGFVANFKSEANAKEDIIMHTDTKEEYGNQIPNPSNFPFHLKDNECVISYTENNKIKYFKIENIQEKPRDEYPSTAPRR